MTGLDGLQGVLDVFEEMDAHRRAWSGFSIERDDISGITSCFGHVERVRGLPTDHRMRVSLVRRATERGSEWIGLYASGPKRRRRSRR